jgi:hypothetical protein
MIIEYFKHWQTNFFDGKPMKILCSVLLVLSLTSPRGWAQDAAEGGEDDIVKSTQSDLMLIAAAGAGGAIIGLSTLSFYDKPSKHVSNIWMGAAVGVIAGVILVAVGHAQKTEEELSLMPSTKMTPEFTTVARSDWHFNNIQAASPVSSAWSAPVWGVRF